MPEAQPARRFEVGAGAALRYITRDGRAGLSWPVVVAQDDDACVALYIPRGAVSLRPRRAEDGSPLPPAEQVWRRDTLRLMFPERSHSVWLHWDVEDGARHFLGWYINLEEPFRRSAIGFDTNDHMLDVVVTPDWQWRWKDAEDFDERVARGTYSAEFAVEVRAEAHRVIAALERRASPFCDGWESWLPSAEWALPTLPAGWDELPATLWQRRHWAYLGSPRPR